MEKSPVSVRANSTRTVVSRCSSTTPPINARENPCATRVRSGFADCEPHFTPSGDRQGRVSYAADADADASTAVKASTLAALVWSWHHTDLPPRPSGSHPHAEASRSMSQSPRPFSL